MTAVIVFFLCHWFLSLFFHSFYLHRYASHKMYNTNRKWEKVFYFTTWFVLGSSYLVPRAYGILHRMHHEYSDTEKDPHSPHFFEDIWRMMIHTARIFSNIVSGKSAPEETFTQAYLPEWDRLDKFGNSMITRLLFGVGYTLFYIFFAPSYWFFLLLPIHFLMGPIQGAIVNWCGHKYGYRNYENGDHSRNSTPFGLLLMGELFQNNHHHQKDNANFARKWFEFDTTYLVMRVLNKMRIIQLLPVPVQQHTHEKGHPASRLDKH
jgi:stearoyl-CoA desaturase (Delta-9 desaturase)